MTRKQCVLVAVVALMVILVGTASAQDAKAILQAASKEGDV